MTNIDQLKNLVEKAAVDEVIVFLKGLSEVERKELVPGLKQLNEYYSEFVDLSTMDKPDKQWAVGSAYGYRARGEQGLVLSLASFICLDKKGFQKGLYPFMILTSKYLDQILPWYVPSWFRQLLEEINTGTNYRLDYDLIMRLEAAGYFTPSPELILLHFPQLIDRPKDGRYAPEEALVKYPDTLHKHFWYIFEYPSNIHNFSRYSKGITSWNELILKFTMDGRLDRMRVLRECLLTANRNFNKVLAGWFVELFNSLQPSKEELEVLQPTLMQLLDSKHSTAVSLALNCFKQIKNLDYNTFITHLPQVILGGTKAILTSVLQLSETIFKEHEAAGQQLSIQLCQIFLNKEESIQQKAAKLISTYGLPATPALQQQLEMYADTMLTGVRSLLLTVPVTIALADEEATEALPLIGEHNLIPVVDTIEDLIYFASQAFENNASYHAELLPAALINLQHLITDEVLIQLKPAVKRAEKLSDRPTSNMGLIDMYLTYFMLNYFNLSDMITTREVKENMLLPHITLFRYALEKLAVKDARPLLSTPTHIPGWIDPVVLVQRLAQYNDSAPHDLDLQIAICRCALEDTTAAIALAKEVLTGEHKDLMLFLLDTTVVSYKEGNAWIQAAIRKGMVLPEMKMPVVYLNGNFEWKTVEEKYLAYGVYNQETRGYERVPATRISFSIEFPGAGSAMRMPDPLLQDYLVRRSKYLELTKADIPRMLSLIPGNPSQVLANIIQAYMPLSALYEVTETNAITAAISWLKDQSYAYTATAQLFIATCMLHADKTIRSLAAECWIAGVSYKRLDSEEIGRVIGIHQSIEWAPLKRFTDMITAQLMQISKQHNEALEILLSACIGLLPDSPVKNLKKLLEVYAEVWVVNGNKVTHPMVKKQLLVWEGVAGFKKLVAKML